jgi:enterobactin synthetase component D
VVEGAWCAGTPPQSLRDSSPVNGGAGNSAILAALRSMAPDLFPSVVPLGSADLHPEEAGLVANAVPRRVAAFAAGRLAARRALQAAGCPQAQVPILWADRTPAPPQGWRLSISHTDDAAVAVACRAEAAAGIGVDIERIDRVEPGMARFIAKPGDRFPDATGPAELAMGFSLREAIYKALDRAAQKGLSRIDLDWTEAGITASPIPAQAPIRYAARQVGDHVLSVCVRLG